jgi:hypothetical protein
MSCSSSLAWPAPMRTTSRSSGDSVTWSRFAKIVKLRSYQAATRSTPCTRELIDELAQLALPRLGQHVPAHAMVHSGWVSEMMPC